VLRPATASLRRCAWSTAVRTAPSQLSCSHAEDATGPDVVPPAGRATKGGDVVFGGRGRTVRIVSAPGVGAGPARPYDEHPGVRGGRGTPWRRRRISRRPRRGPPGRWRARPGWPGWRPGARAAGRVWPRIRPPPRRRPAARPAGGGARWPRPPTARCARAGPRPRRRSTSPAGRPAGPRYLQLERKELRIRVDQADELARLTRRINRSRRGAGERITDNTLIRVAVDLLLERSAHIAGTTEDELRESLTSTGGDVNRPG
jgi:hypothetical protein